MCPDKFVTGTVVAIKGSISSNGFFEASDVVFPGIPPIHSMPEKYNEIIADTSDTLQRDMFEDLENREFVAFVSGIAFNGVNIKNETERLAQWICGEYGKPKDQLLSSRITRFIIGGNNIGEEEDINEVIKGSFVTHDINEQVYNSISNSIESFEEFIKMVGQKCDVDIMPGDNDIAGSFFPQQKFNIYLFPSLIKDKNIIFSTNPHMFSINDLLFLGTSGQNIEDISRCKDMTGLKAVDILEETLEMRHLAPTSPDTLRSYPFTTDDPLIIEETPNIYFSCNANEFESKTIKHVDGMTKIITIPSFSKTSSIVLLDLDTLETYKYTILTLKK